MLSEIHNTVLWISDVMPQSLIVCNTRSYQMDTLITSSGDNKENAIWTCNLQLVASLRTYTILPYTYLTPV